MPNNNNLVNKYNLIICELQHTRLHGSDIGRFGPHYLVHSYYNGPNGGLICPEISFTYDSNDPNYSYNFNLNQLPKQIYTDSFNNINNFIEWITAEYEEAAENQYFNVHSHIRNYKHIISSQKYIKPEIAHCILLPTNELVAILKTFWIRIIQRAWKRVYKVRKDVIAKRCQPHAILEFQRTGYWPSNCRHLPTIRGLLTNY